MTPMRVALIGSRGIPASYGGYETLMEELASRLVERGVEVTVYCRSHYTPRELTEHLGAELVVLPTIRTKHLDTPVHTLLSCLHAFGRSVRRSRRRFDAALVVNSANALFLPILSAGRIPSALNVDGIEKRRAKWGPLGTLRLRRLRASGHDPAQDPDHRRRDDPRALRRTLRRAVDDHHLWGRPDAPATGRNARAPGAPEP